MPLPTAQNLLSAQHGLRRVTIGWDDETALRLLSDERALTCPGCGGLVVLHAGRLRAHHFAHLPGAVCKLPQTEPETEEHRAGKLLLARWLRHCLSDAEIIVEAFLPATGQRADVLAILPGRPERRLAFEFQCANLVAREWRRRHRLYRDNGIEDLWLLGGSRYVADTPAAAGKTNEADKAAHTLGLRTTELERALFWDGAPLLFLASQDGTFPAETLARFRPDAESQAARLAGKVTVRPLLALDFPHTLFDWPHATHPDSPPVTTARFASPLEQKSTTGDADGWLWAWLAQRHQVTKQTLAPFFSLPIAKQECFACAMEAWQAAIYYRFVHRRVGDAWWLAEVERWARSYLPLVRPVNLKNLQSVLADYQEVLAAAGMLSLPMGYGRVHARVLADLTTLPAPPDPEETLRLARYRRTLSREAKAEYQANARPG